MSIAQCPVDAQRKKPDIFSHSKIFSNFSKYLHRLKPAMFRKKSGTLHTYIVYAGLAIVGTLALVAKLTNSFQDHISNISESSYYEEPKRSDFLYKFVAHRQFISKKDNEDENPRSSRTVYVISATYKRPEQIADLTRLSQALYTVPNVHWIVAEDAVLPSSTVLTFLNETNLNFTYILGTSVKTYAYAAKAKGVANRNAALLWLKNNVKTGVLYFADDDNTYDSRLFEQIRETQRVSVFPVGLVTHLGVSSPIVKNGKVIGFYDGWISNRKFPLDMAGFAVNIEFYLEMGAPYMPYIMGYEEDGFLRALDLSLSDIEPLASNCTKILVWHTRTVPNLTPQHRFLKPEDNNTNLHQLLKAVLL